MTIDRDALAGFLREHDDDMVIVPRKLLARVLDAAEDDSRTAEHHDALISSRSEYRRDRQAIRDLRIAAGIKS
jgi:hypothetical protein